MSLMIQVVMKQQDGIDNSMDRKLIDEETKNRLIAALSDYKTDEEIKNPLTLED